MNKHAQRQQIALKAQQYRQSQRAGTSASQTQPAPKRFLRQALLILLVAILAIGGFVLLHASLNTSTSPNAVRTSGNGSALHISPPSGTPATPQVRTGIFAPGTGGPLPVPANVLKPSNSARIVLNNEIYSIYAGAMTRQPEVGVLAVLQENAVSGKQNLHLYQSPRHLGSLTILSLQQNIVHFEAANGSQGTFNLLTGQFQFS